MRYLSVGLLLVMNVPSCAAWWESGHHMIALLAFDELSASDQQTMMEILKSHPRYPDDFQPPRGVRDGRRWQVGRMGYWPDVARQHPEYDRPFWHFQLGATLSLGSDVNVPADPGPLPEAADMATRELHIAQAFALCRRTFADHTESLEHRAVAMCWLAHLVGDSHQPCHAGSLYAEAIFPDGDRGANSIPTRQHENLHAFWDSIHGPEFDEEAVEKIIRETRANDRLWQKARATARQRNDQNMETWLAESREHSQRYVYTPLVVNAVTAARRSGRDVVETIDLPELYQKDAADIARQRATFAALRLAEVWRQCLAGNR